MIGPQKKPVTAHGYLPILLIRLTGDATAARE